MEVPADIRAAPAASLAGKPQLEIGQPDVIRPSITADRCVVAALVIRAINQEAVHASSAHFGEGDLLAGGSGHADLRAPKLPRWKPLDLVEE